MEESKTGYVYIDNVEGVAIIPYRMGANGKEILVRDEYTPLHDTVLSIITGRRDADDASGQAAARRELLEEAGILAEERWFNEVGEILPAGSYKRPDTMYVVDVTGVHEGKPVTDGSIFEKKSTNMWVPVSELARIVREPNGVPDAYFLAAITKFLVWCGLIKSEESDLMKAKKGSEKPGHKYIRRKPKKSGKPGYDYIYQEPKGKGPKKDDKGKKPTMVEQLAALIGKKQGGEEEKKPKKQLPWDEFNRVPFGMPDFMKGVTAAQWSEKINREVTSSANGFISDLDDADHDFMNNPNKIDSSNAVYALKMLERAQNSIQKINPEEISVENKKLNDNAQREVRKAISRMSRQLGVANYLKAAFDSSLFENIFDNFSTKMKSDKWSKSSYKKLDQLSTIISVTMNNLEAMDQEVRDFKWLQGSDPKLDWITDQVFEAVDGLMRSRNRFAKNGLKFFIDELSPLVESLSDAEEITKAVKLKEQLDIFIDEVIHSSTTARRLGVFANQWNLKQKGIYDGASRFSSYAAGKLVDKVKSLENIGDDEIVQNYINELANNPSFSFLSMSSTAEHFAVSEQVFSYIDMHGMDKYYRDMVFLTGGRIRKETPKGYETQYQDCVATLTKAYNGEDVYNDDDVLHQSEKWSGGVGHMKKGRFAALYAAMNTMILMNKKSPDSSKIPAFIRMWSSASHGSIMSNAVEAFVEAKNVDRGSYVNYHIATNRTVTPKRVSTRDALLDSIERVYKDTQNTLSSYYSDDAKIQLFRGNGDAEIKSSVSSWTPVDHIAANFGHVVSVVDAPAKSVLLANTIENEQYWTFPAEREFVLMPGLLPTDEKLNPEILLSDQRQKILDKKLKQDFDTYGDDY